MSSSPPTGPVEDAAAPPPPPVDINEPTQTKEDEPPKSDAPLHLDALIAELRASLASSQTLLSTQATRLSTLTDTETELNQMKDQYAFLAAAKEAVEKQLQEETKRREMAEENVEMLRGQVEQARRGVGILQKQEKERKRLSFIPNLHKDADIEEGSTDAPKEGLTSRASKRASMLLGRTQKVSPSDNTETGPLPLSPSVPSNTSPSANARAGLRELRLGSGNTQVTGTNAAATSPSATPSNFIEDLASMPAHPPLPHQDSAPSVTSPGSEGMPSNTEEARLRDELAATRSKLSVAEEARDASEACLKALREFMAAGGTAGEAADGDLLKSIRLPPLPTDSNLEEDLLQPEQPKKTWGFKLWKQGPTSPASTAVEPPATPYDNLSPPSSVRGTTPRKDSTPLPTPGEGPTEGTVNALPGSSTPLGNFVTGWTRGVAPSTPADGTTGKPNAARTLSSFFSRKKDEGSKEKELPAQPEDPADENAIRREVAEEGLQPSPQIAEKAIEEPGRAQAEVMPVEGKGKEDTEEAEQKTDGLGEVKDSPNTISLNEPVEETIAVPRAEVDEQKDDKEGVKGDGAKKDTA